MAGLASAISLRVEVFPVPAPASITRLSPCRTASKIASCSGVGCNDAMPVLSKKKGYRHRGEG